MAIPVTLEVFEGPLDLLLYLIDKNKVDIYDIPIVTITDQYMAYIKAMEERDMNIVSEFLVMAATLIDIKCRMLLPLEVNEEGEEEDPRDELVQKLLEYKMVRYLSVELKDRQLEAGYNLYHKRNIPPEVARHEEPIDYEALIGDLILKRLDDKIDPVRSSFGNIEKEEIDISLKATYIEAYTREHKRFSFRSLLEKQGSKSELIVTFLVVLEMIRIGKVTIEQEENFADIIITNNDDNNERIDLAQIG